jgi:hypothetical protein
MGIDSRFLGNDREKSDGDKEFFHNWSIGQWVNWVII